MQVDQRLVDAATAFLERRFAGEPYEGAAAAYTEDGEILISTAMKVLNEAVAVCHETGIFCEAYTREKNIAAIACVSREPDGRIVILPPCGVCQERLWTWGGDVEAAVPLERDNTQWMSVPLKALSPHYWRKYLDA